MYDKNNKNLQKLLSSPNNSPGFDDFVNSLHYPNDDDDDNNDDDYDEDEDHEEDDDVESVKYDENGEEETEEAKETRVSYI